MGELVQLLTTLGSKADALALAQAAVEHRVAACVQVVGPITSVYRWEGRLEESEEFLCLMKVPANGLERLVGFVREQHPYDTPELTAVESLFVDDRYANWAKGEVAPGTD
jgi:periplasmic divalent cation tolerance protein